MENLQKNKEEDLSDLNRNEFFIDERDGRQYKTFRKGQLIWIAENYCFNSGTSLSYMNDPTLGNIFGRAYSYKSALHSCPIGFNIPTIEEWQGLLTSTKEIKDLTIKGTSGFDASSIGFFWNGEDIMTHHTVFYWTSSKSQSGKQIVFGFDFLHNIIIEEEFSSNYATALRVVKRSKK